MCAVQMQQERNQRHAHRHAIGRLLEINRAPVGIERGVEFVDPRQRVHDARLRIFVLAEKFGVDLRIGPLFLGPSLLLEARHIPASIFCFRIRP